jgi:hypothetical protein
VNKLYRVASITKIVNKLYRTASVINPGKEEKKNFRRGFNIKILNKLSWGG